MSILKYLRKPKITIATALLGLGLLGYTLLEGLPGLDSSKSHVSRFQKVYTQMTMKRRELKDIKVFDTHKRLLAKIRTDNYDSINEFPRHFLDILLAAEDKKFLEHDGYDIFSLLGITHDLFKKFSIRGGSTITMQVIDMLNNNGKTDLIGKIREIWGARGIEDEFSKRDILNVYINLCRFNHHIIGYGDAGRVFFGKEPNELTLENMIALTQIPRAPWHYNPYTEEGKRRIKERSKVIRDRLYFKDKVGNGYLDGLQPKDSLKIVQTKFPYMMNTLTWVIQNWASENHDDPRKYNFSDKNSVLRTGAAEIYTTLDIDLLIELKRVAMRNKNKNLKDVGYILISPIEGNVLGFYENSEFGDRSFLTGNRTQTGSSEAKWIIHGLALDYGIITPYQELDDSILGIQPKSGYSNTTRAFELDNGIIYEVSSNGNEFKGQKRLIEHLIESNNIVTVHLLLELSRKTDFIGPDYMHKIFRFNGTDVSRYGKFHF
ncbi:MAG: transglycosylase domain-containing protein, partial [Candidatus Woesearchaeota archaeon]